MYKKFELFIIVTVSLTLLGSATLNGMPTLAQSNITNDSKIGDNVTAKGMAGIASGGVDIDSSSTMIDCAGEIKGPVKTEGVQADAFVRHETFFGTWRIVNENATHQDKGGIINGGWTDGKKYQIKGVEQYDGICKAKLPKDITISGDCGTGVEIKYATANGNSGDTFKGNARCYVSTANFTSAVNMTGTDGNKTGNTTERLNLTTKMQELQKGNMTGTEGNKTGNTTDPLNLTAKMQELQK